MDNKTRARRERMRRRRRQVMIARVVILIALLAVLGVCLVFLYRAIHPKQEPAEAAETESSAGTVVTVPEESESAAKSEINYAEISVAEMPEAAQYTSTDKAASVAKAEKLAAMYDYDTAIAVLQGYTGYQDDTEVRNLIGKYTNAKTNLVPVEVTTVPHVFYHSLLNDSRGLIADVVGERIAKGNDCWMCTSEEFNTITQQMYDAGCVLIRLRDLVKETRAEDGTVTFAKNDSLMLPEGKKAVIMSEDDLGYYHSYDGQGYASKMVIDEHGLVKCEYYGPDGMKHIGDYDVVPLLATFIENHPDFSYKNAHLIIAMTGYNGCFGYRTDAAYKTRENLGADQAAWLDAHPEFDWDQDVAEATKIADAIKAEGFEFASHTWGHLRAASKPLETLQADQERFKNTVRNIVGDVDTIIFAHGEDIGNWQDYSTDNEKYNYYKSEGYNFYCNVDGSTPYWIQIREHYVRTGRVDIDGYRLYKAMTGDEHSVADMEAIGVHDIASFFDPNRITPVDITG